MKPTTTILSTVLLLLVISASNSFTFIQPSVDASPIIVSESSVYTILLTRQYAPSLTPTPWDTQLVPIGSQIIVLFPNEFTLDNLATAQCTDLLFGTNQVTGFTYTFTGNTLTISNAFTVALAVSDVTIVLSDIVNPGVALTTSPFQASIGVDVAANSTQSAISFFPSQLTSLTITFANPIVNRTSNMQFTLVLAHKIPANGAITLQFQSLLWTRQVAGSSHVLPLASVSTCTGISSNINSILTCSGSANTLIITITSISSSEISAGSTVLFSIADLFSPPTCESIDIITVTTCDSALNQIDQSQGTISGLIPQQLTDFSLRSSLSKLVVNNFLGGLNISFTLTDTLSNKDYFVITFPSNVTVDYSNKQSSFIIATVSYNSTANTLTFTQTSTSANYNVGTAGYLLFIKFKAPPSIRPTAPITFAVVNNNASRMVGTATITASPNTYSLAVSTTGQQISQFASYSFTVNTTDALTATGVIVITLPAEFSLVAPQLATLATNLTASVTGRNINTIPTVRTSISPSNANQYIITLSNLNASSSIPGQSLTIIINNLLNPYYVCTVTSFTVSTYYTNNVAIDLVANAVSTTSITYTPGTITSLSATSTSLMTYSSTTVSVTFTTKSPLFSGCFIILVLPTKLLVSTSTPSSCSLTVNSNPIILPPSSYTFNIVNNSITVALSSTISANSIVILSFTIISPESTAVTGTFSVSTVGPTLTLIDQSNAIATLQMTKGNPFASISVTRSSAKNSQLTKYIISFTQTQSPTSATSVQLLFKSSISIAQVTSVIQISALGIETPLDFLYIAPSTLTVTLIALPTHLIGIYNVRNPRSLAPIIDPIYITTLANDLSIYSQMYTPTITDETASQLQISSFSFSSYAYSLPTNLTLTIQFNTFTAGFTTFVSIVVPIAIGTASLTITSSLALTVANSAANSYILSLSQSAPFPSTLTITLNNLLAPAVNSSYFTISTYDNSIPSQLMQSNNNTISFINDCSSTCATCLSTSTSSCLTCYPSAPLLYHFACYTTCPDGSFLATVSTCTACANTCTTCASSATNCTSCSTLVAIHLYIDNTKTGTCYTNCPTSTYATVDHCLPCSINCTNCTASDNCFQCTSSYLYNNACVFVCPASTIIINNACVTCNTNCLTCITLPTTCTSCLVPKVLSNSVCYDSCPLTNMYVLNSKCELCDTKCLTCVTTATQCLSCATPKFLLNKSCITTCPQTYYPQSPQQICQLCSTANIYCNNCSSATTCLTCDTGYYIFTVNHSCLNTAPPGYIIYNNAITACTIPCNQCSTLPTNCTKCIASYSLLGTTCVTNCPASTMLSINSVCTSCTLPCVTCNNTLTSCLSCTPNTGVFIDNVANLCVSICPVGTYADTDKWSCEACLASCSACSVSATNCSSCSTSFYLYQHTCVNPCPSKTVAINDAAGNYCQPCTTPCLTCAISPTSCLSCVTNTPTLYLSHTTCISTCPDGTYPDNTLFRCANCDSKCSTCTSLTVCTSCSATYFLDTAAKTCGNVCPSSTVAVVNQITGKGICIPCTNPCLTCVTTVTNCLSCSQVSSALFLSNNACVSAANCPATTYPNSTSLHCEPCVAPCNTCTTYLQCLTCNAGLYYVTSDKSCPSTCPSGTLPQTIADLGVCSACTSPCLTCITTLTTCQSCSQTGSPLYLNNNNCIAAFQCPASTYPDSTLFQCVTCTISCQTCTSSTICQTCKTGLYLSLTTCTNTCPSGTLTVITDGLGVCQPCVYPCLTCTITVNQCLSCSQEISALYLSGNTCVASSACPSTAYPDSATFKCVSCAAPCNKCTSAANCLNCDVGYILNSITHLCDSTCAVGTIPLVVDGANTCIACTLPCLTCVTTVTKCLSCSQVSSALYLSNNVCVADVNCPATTYPNSTSLHCEPCVAPCNTCTSYLHCLTCNTGFNFISSNFTCSDSCAIGTIPLTTSEGRICTACTFPCLTCVTTLTNCLSCSQLPTALYLSNGVCVPKCPASIFSNTDLMHCQTCVTGCSVCQTAVNHCTQCNTGYFLDSTTNLCVTICPGNTLAISATKSCTVCTTPCASCTTTLTTCSSCQSSYYLDTITSQCQTICPSKYYPNTLTNICSPCSSSCKQCTTTSSNCISCSTTQYLSSSTCVNACPSGQYADTTRTCQTCAASCVTCSSLSTNCTSCSAPLVLLNNVCSSACPASLPYNVSGVCKDCATLFSGCASCNSTPTCLSCTGSLIYFNEHCISNCPNNYTLDSKINQCLLSNNTNSTLVTTLSSTTIFPMPFTIVGLVVFLACFMSKLQNRNTYIFGTAYSLFGFIETACLVKLIITYHYYLNSHDTATKNTIYLYAALALILTLNIFGLFLQNIYLHSDKRFHHWQSLPSNYIFYMVVSLLSFLINYKVKMVIFSRMFAFACTRGVLDNVQKFRVFNVLSFVGVAHQGLVVYIAALTAASVGTGETMFLQWIDLVCVNVVSMCLALAVSQKDADFFEQIDQNDMKLNKIVNISEDYDLKMSPYDPNHNNQGSIQSIDKLHDDNLEDDQFSYSLSNQGDNPREQQQSGNALVGIKITPRKPERRSPGKQQTGKSTTLGKSMLLPKKYKKVTPELAIKTDRIDNVYLEGQSEPRNIFEVREFDVEEIYQGDNAIKGDVEVTDRENGITQDEQSNKQTTFSNDIQQIKLQKQSVPTHLAKQEQIDTAISKKQKQLQQIRNSIKSKQRRSERRGKQKEKLSVYQKSSQANEDIQREGPITNNFLTEQTPKNEKIVNMTNPIEQNAVTIMNQITIGETNGVIKYHEPDENIIDEDELVFQEAHSKIPSNDTIPIERTKQSHSPLNNQTSQDNIEQLLVDAYMNQANSSINSKTSHSQQANHNATNETELYQHQYSDHIDHSELRNNQIPLLDSHREVLDIDPRQEISIHQQNIFDYQVEDNLFEQIAPNFTLEQLLPKHKNNRKNLSVDGGNVQMPVNRQFKTAFNQRSQERPLRIKIAPKNNAYGSNSNIAPGETNERDKQALMQILQQQQLEKKQHSRRNHLRRVQMRQQDDQKTIKDHSTAEIITVNQSKQQQLNKRRIIMNDGKQTKTAAQIRPSTVVKSRMYLAGLNQLSDGVTGPIQKSLSSNKYQQISDIAPNTPINTKRQFDSAYPMGIDFNQLRYESHTLARRDVTELPQKPFVAKDLTARTRQNYQLQDTTFERSRQPSARSYKSRSVQRQEYQKQQSSKQKKSSQDDDDLQQYYKPKKSKSKSRSRSKEANKSSDKKLTDLEKIYLQRLDTHPRRQPYKAKRMDGL